MSDLTKRSRNSVLLLLILSLPLLIQLKEITRPYLGHFGSYQGTVMASMARNYQAEHFASILLPKTDVIIYGNQKSLHLNQFPLPSLLAGLGSSYLGGNLEFWGRFQAIAFHLVSMLMIFFWIKKLWGEKAALLGATIFAFCPQTLIYGQAFMNESAALFFLLGSILLFHHWKENRRPLTLIAAAFFYALTLVNRIHWLVYFPWFLLEQINFKQIKKVDFLNLGLFIFVSASLPFLWTFYTYRTALEHSNVHTSFLIQFLNPEGKSLPLLTHVKFYRGLCISLLKLISIPCVPFLIIGFWRSVKEKSLRWISFAFLCGMATILMAPQKVLDHNFYLYSLTPWVTILSTYGFIQVINRFPKRRILLTSVWISCVIIMGLGQSLKPLWIVSSEEKSDYARMTQIEKLLPPDAKVILATGSPTASFYLNRAFWSLDLESTNQSLAPYATDHRLRKVTAEEISQLTAWLANPVLAIREMTEKGASYLAVVRPDEIATKPEVLTYLREHAELITTKQDPFQIYKLAR